MTAPPLSLSTLLANFSNATTVGKLRALRELRNRLDAELDGLELDLIRRARSPAEQVPLAEIGRAIDASKSTVSRWLRDGRISR
jgi:hypothetical protein